MKSQEHMKYLILSSALFACGPETIIEVESDCQPYDNDYSHTITYCGEPDPDNIQNMFVLCNPRELEAESCSDDLILRELGDDCHATNVCLGDNVQ